MRSAVLAFLVVGLVGLLALGVRATTSTSDRVQTLGVAPAGPVAPLARGQEVCQTPVGLSGAIDAVEFNPGSEGRRTPGLRVEVRAARDGRVLGRGRLPAGFDRTRPQTVRVGEVAGDQLVSLCVRNLGPARAVVFGDVPTGLYCTPSGRTVSPQAIACAPGRVRPTVTTSEARVGRRALEGDLAMVLRRDEPRSLLARVPTVFERASLFRPAFVGPGLWWALAALVLLAAPVLLVVALRAATRADGDRG
jgi:hypothetical protein